jgi:hypothetical protein
MLYVNLFFGVQRKALCVSASLRANFFFSRKAGKAQRKTPWRLGAFARVNSFFSLRREVSLR